MQVWIDIQFETKIWDFESSNILYISSMNNAFMKKRMLQGLWEKL